jgi:hypothetical protein
MTIFPLWRTFRNSHTLNNNNNNNKTWWSSSSSSWNYILFTFRACAINTVNLVAKVNNEGHRTSRADFFNSTSVSTRGTSLNRNTFYFMRMRNTTVTLVAKVKVKVKQSRNRPGVAQRVPGGLGSQISMTFGTWRWCGCQPRVPAAFSPRNVPGTHFH